MSEEEKESSTRDQAKTWKAMQAQVQMLAKRAEQARQEKAAKSK